MRNDVYDDAAFSGEDSRLARGAFLDENTDENACAVDFFGAAGIDCYVAMGNFPGERHTHFQPTSLLKYGPTEKGRFETGLAA
jgi:hypothetical protein